MKTSTPAALDELPIHLEQEDLSPVDAFRRQHKTALLVILFTDLKGSTEMAERRGETYAQGVRQQVEGLLREIIEHRGAGQCLKNIGDSLMCIFAEPTAAVERSVQIQQRLADYNRAHPEDAPVQVRIGMHLGQVAVEDQVRLDVFGRHVNRAARVEALAQGGQILMTLPVYDNARGWLAERGLVWQDHGAYLLKGIDEPTQVYEVCFPGGPVPHAPPGVRYRRSRRAWLIAASLAALSVLVAWHLYPSRTPLSSQLTVRVARHGEMVEFDRAVPLSSGDDLQVVGELSRPAYACLLWFDTEGKAQVVASSGEERVKEITYPPRDWVRLEGKAGTEVIVVVVSDQPLQALPAVVRELEAAGAWPRLPEPGSAWLNPEETVWRRFHDRRPGRIVRQEPKDPLYRADRLRQLLHREFDSFHGVVFPHRD